VKPMVPLFRTIVLLTVFASLMFGPLLPAHAAHAYQDEVQLSVMILSPLGKVYEGDTIRLGYWVEDPDAYGGITLAPLTPGKASASARLGKVEAKPAGNSGTITYTAKAIGSEMITLKVNNGFGVGTGSVGFKVYSRPNYKIKFVAISQDSDEAGGAFYSLFSGNGKFADDPDHPINGSGRADLWFSLWVSNNVMSCSMEPTVQGSTSFEVTGTSGPVGLLPGSPGSMLLDLNFATLNTNASVLRCVGLGGFQVTFDWPASSGDPDSHHFKQLFFTEDGGSVPITAPKTWGYVLVTRIKK
jgi:hypothetical protein